MTGPFKLGHHPPATAASSIDHLLNRVRGLTTTTMIYQSGTPSSKVGSSRHLHPPRSNHSHHHHHYRPCSKSTMRTSSTTQMQCSPSFPRLQCSTTASSSSLWSSSSSSFSLRKHGSSSSLMPGGWRRRSRRPPALLFQHPSMVV